jgi:hypothetical protein
VVAPSGAFFLVLRLDLLSPIKPLKEPIGDPPKNTKIYQKATNNHHQPPWPYFRVCVSVAALGLVKDDQYGEGVDYCRLWCPDP